MLTNAEAQEKAIDELATVQSKLTDLKHLPDEMSKLKKRYEVASQALTSAQAQRDDAQHNLEGTSTSLERVRQELDEAVATHASEMDTHTTSLEAAVAQAEAHHQGACNTELAIWLAGLRCQEYVLAHVM